MRDFDRDVGLAVRRRRGDTSQEVLAAAMRLRGHDKWSQSTVWAVETGSRPLRLSEAIDLASELKVSLEEFISGEGRADVHRAINDVGIAAHGFAVAALRLQRAQQEVESVLAAHEVSLDDLPLSPMRRAEVTLPVDELAARVVAGATGGDEDPATLEGRPLAGELASVDSEQVRRVLARRRLRRE